MNNNFKGNGYEQLENALKEQEEKIQKMEKENRALKGEINNITLPELLRIEKDLEQALKLVRQRIVVSGGITSSSSSTIEDLCSSCTKTVGECAICSHKSKGVKLRAVV